MTSHDQDESDEIHQVHAATELVDEIMATAFERRSPLALSGVHSAFMRSVSITII
jgi:hypothetical protein